MMNALVRMQDRFGFTRSEILVILFLVATFLCGLGVRWYSNTVSPEVAPRFDYSQLDSIFEARSQAHEVLSPAEGRPTDRTSVRKLSSPGTHIDINTAVKEDLMRLPGIGAALADRVIAYRDENGPFASVNDLAHVRGIGKKKLDRLRIFAVVR